MDCTQRGFLGYNPRPAWLSFPQRPLGLRIFQGASAVLTVTARLDGSFPRSDICVLSEIWSVALSGALHKNSQRGAHGCAPRRYYVLRHIPATSKAGLQASIPEPIPDEELVLRHSSHVYLVSVWLRIQSGAVHDRV
jgi:hypothetical protein